MLQQLTVLESFTKHQWTQINLTYTFNYLLAHVCVCVMYVCVGGRGDLSVYFASHSLFLLRNINETF